MARSDSSMGSCRELVFSLAANRSPALKVFAASQMHFLAPGGPSKHALESDRGGAVEQHSSEGGSCIEDSKEAFRNQLRSHSHLCESAKACSGQDWRYRKETAYLKLRKSVSLDESSLATEGS